MIFTIDSLNYASSGDRRGMINIDYIPQAISARILAGTEEGVGQISGLQLEPGIDSEISGVKAEPDVLVGIDTKGRPLNASYVFDRDYDTVSSDLNVVLGFDGRVMPMYDVTDVCVKSPVSKVDGPNETLPNTDSKVDIYAPSMERQPLGFCNYDDRTVLMTDEMDSKNGPQLLGTSFRSSSQAVPNEPYTMSLAAKAEHEYMYPEPGQLNPLIRKMPPPETYEEYVRRAHTLETEQQVISAIHEIFAQKTDNRGIKYEHVVNMEQSETVLKYLDGDVYGTSTPGKMTYNCLYTQEGSNFDINGARSYVGVTESSGKIYLKFNDNVRYASSGTAQSSGTTVLTPSKDTSHIRPTYQKIERYNPQRTSDSAKHKSNLFSIRIRNSGLGTRSGTESQDFEHETSVLKRDIENSIRQIVENITPVNTQLFKVYFEED